MYTSTEQCLVCRKKTYGSIFCSLECHKTYESNKSKFKKRKLIIEIKEETKSEREQYKESVEEFLTKNNKKSKKKKLVNQSIIKKSFLDSKPLTNFFKKSEKSMGHRGNYIDMGKISYNGEF